MARDRESESGGKPITIIQNQQQLGKLIGVTREAVNKQLNEWEDLGLIRLGRGRLTITDLPGLEEVARNLS